MTTHSGNRANRLLRGLLCILLVLAGLVVAPEVANAVGAFSATGSMSVPRVAAVSATLPNGKVFIAGGTTGPTILNTAEIFDPATGTFTPVTATMSSPHAYATASLLRNGKVLVAGGINSSGMPTSAADLYDPVTGQFSNVGPMIYAHSSAMAAVMPNGMALIAGGTDSSNNAQVAAEYFDPSDNSFHATSGSMSVARYGGTATTLTDGSVLIAGGSDSSATAEIYNPATKTFGALIPMSVARTYDVASLLDNGKVLVVGGFYNNVAQASSELFDPVSGTFSNTASLSTARYEAVAVKLPNGRVLVAGGYDGSHTLDSAELYDATTGTFIATGSMVTPLASLVGNVLPNGQVLVAGGYDSGPAQFAELYTTTSYPVTYDANGAASGSAPTDPSSPYEAGITVTVLPNSGSLSKPGEMFDGWNTAADGSGTSYPPGATFTMPSHAVTLFAQFKALAVQVPAHDCVPAGSSHRLPRTGTTRLMKPGCETTAGIRIGLRAHVTARGDVQLSSLFCKAAGSKPTKVAHLSDGRDYCRKGALKIRTYGRSIKAAIVWSAPATDTYLAYEHKHTYKS